MKPERVSATSSVCVQSLQRPLKHLPQIRGGIVEPLAALVAPDTGLGGDFKAVAGLPQIIADQGFGPPVAIDLGGVQKGDAVVGGGVEAAERSRLIRFPVETAKIHASEADAADLSF
jgi:hypothetical protein